MAAAYRVTWRRPYGRDSCYAFVDDLPTARELVFVLEVAHQYTKIEEIHATGEFTEIYHRGKA